MTTFKDLKINPDTIELLRKSGIVQPTEVQSLSIPQITAGMDVIAEAQTGTGKTLAFLLPMFEMISVEDPHIQGLIITPTRELAIQITDEAKKLSVIKPLNILAAYGGQDLAKQFKKLNGGIHIVIATPGRLLDHMRRETIKLDHLKTLVLDEADQMLHLGFKNEVEMIIKKSASDRQTLCFSATMNRDVKKLAYRFMKEPVVIETQKEEITLKNITQMIIETTDRHKQSDLCKILDADNPFMGIIFCRTVRRADILETALHQRGYKVLKLHGEMTQNNRERVMKSFRKLEFQYLIATDVASRGLDINGVTHIYNYDIPENGEAYIHRIGRTGRAKEKGMAYTFVAQKDRPTLHLIEKEIEMTIPVHPDFIPNVVAQHNTNDTKKPFRRSPKRADRR